MILKAKWKWVTEPDFRKKCWGPLGPDFRGQKRPFLLLLEYDTLDRSENLSEDSSNKDLSNHVGHSYLKNLVDPPGVTFLSDDVIYGHPLGSKKSEFFFCFFLRIEAFWFQKCNKKFLIRKFPLPGHVTWDLEFFRKIMKIFDFFFRFFFRIESFEKKFK